MQSRCISKGVLLAAQFAILAYGTASGRCATPQDSLLVEAEGFDDHGGWVLDTQFIEIMGSPYLMAHGLGQPVSDATTTVTFPATGKWRLWVRTMDWVARWDAPGRPGRFQLLLNGQPVEATFGTKGSDWLWHDGGVVEIDTPTVSIALHDLTGFNGRCDAILFARDLNCDSPPEDKHILPRWRRALQGLPEKPDDLGPFELVVAGGGYAGMCAAISAARDGLKVALIQNRPVLGGNASSEIAVPLRGQIPADGPYPLLGRIVSQLQYDAHDDAQMATAADDAHHEEVVRAEENVTLLLNHHAYAVEMDNERIAAVLALDTRTNARKRIAGRLFSDCTGHGTIGVLAGADYEMASAEDIVMGMTNKWDWEMTGTAQRFPITPWALDLDVGDFPRTTGHGGWNWESGYYRNPIADLEYIRDWNLRAVFGAWNAMKNRGGAEEHANARLTRVVYVGGTRESRRLMGDIILSEDDMLNRVEFNDGFVPVTWYLDRHHPHPGFAHKYPEDPFIAQGGHKPGTRREDRPRHGEPWWGIPYRCLYSRNVPNLFMAGRDISTTLWALGAVRVMRTGGMMGEVVGQAARICVEKNCMPREVYQDHLELLQERFTGEAPR